MPSEQEQLQKRFEKIQKENLELIQIVKDTSAELAAKNYELKIEAALESVRIKAMAMQASHDLKDVAKELRIQLYMLGQNELETCAIHLWDENSGQFEAWAALRSPDNTGNIIESESKLNIKGIKILEENFQHYIEGKKDYILINDVAKAKEFFEALKPIDPTAYTFLFPPIKNKNPEEICAYWSVSDFTGGSLVMVTMNPPEENSRALLRRFANVFGLAFRRFSDLQKAEAQAREAEIELALERVRASSMAMKYPSEFVDVINVIGEQFIRLHIDIDWVNFGANGLDISDAIDVWNFAIIPGGFHIASRLLIPYLNNPIFTDAVKTLNKYLTTGEDFFQLTYNKEDKDIWLGHLFTLENFKNIPDEIKTIQYEKPGYTHSNIALKDTWLSIGKLDTKPFTDAQNAVLRKFANAFGQAHTRFLDLKKAETQARAAELEKQRSETLLLNILPREIADELKQFGKSYARKHEQVTILFSDIKGFSTISETLSPEELVNQLDECFRAFDKIVEKHGLEKIKTIGDAYVCACGLPNPDPEHAIKTVKAAIDMLAFSKGFGMTKKIQDLPVFDFRFGIHTGPVVTGVVGLKKFTYDIWGDAVNMAARMEQHGEAGRINISAATYQLVKDKFNCTHRGKLEAKNKGMVDMYFVEE